MDMEYEATINRAVQISSHSNKMMHYFTIMRIYSETYFEGKNDDIITMRYDLLLRLKAYEHIFAHIQLKWNTF